MSKWTIIAISILLAVGCGPKGEQTKAPPKDKEDTNQQPDSNRTKTDDEPSADDDADQTGQPNTIVLDRSRSYQLEVEKVLPDVLLLYLKRWTFDDEIPAAMLAGLKKHPNFEVPGAELFGVSDDDPNEDRGHIFWKPAADGPQIGAALLFANGEKRKVLDVSFEVVLDHTLGKDDESADVSFDSLSAKVDLAKSSISKIRWGDEALPDSDSDGVETEEFLQVSFIGQLSAESSQQISAANRLMSEEITQRFRELSQTSLSNDSHHGISLGWMGNEDLDHNLMILPSAGDEPVSFRYRVGGNPFSLDLIRNQLAHDGWPMVLRGQEYLGTAGDSTYIMRPIEIILSRQGSSENQDNESK